MGPKVSFYQNVMATIPILPRGKKGRPDPSVSFSKQVFIPIMQSNFDGGVFRPKVN